MAQRQSPKKHDPKEATWARLSRTASFWIIVILLPALIFNLIRARGEPRFEFSYTDFRSELEQGNVQEVTIIQGIRIEGEFKRAVNRNGTDYVAFDVNLPGEITDRLTGELEAQGVVIRGEPEQTPWWTFLIGALPWVILIVFWFWLLRTMQGGGNKAFQFGRSKAKLISPDTPKVTFADVAGADEAKNELQEIIEFLKDPQKFSRLGGRLPKGVLLVGPPGTGKTLMAKAVAGEAGRPFFQMSGSDFVEMFVGVGASRVRDLFEQGKAHAPCIVFIDEIDAVGRHRGAGLGGGHDEREQTLNQLLVEMDGFEANDGVILLAATNRPDVLDPALLRPGRFDRHVIVDSPDVLGREQILKVHARKLPLADDVELAIVAKGTPGLSGADLANICNEAALLAARGGAEKVTMDDFESAKDKVMLGTERRSMVLTENERKLTAYHEAGHAVIGLRIPGLDPIHKVTIVPRGRALGITASLPQEDRHSYTKDWLEGQLAMLYGGRVAEEMIFGPTKITTGAGNDLERATQIARRMVTRFGMSDLIGLMAVGESEHEVFLGRDMTTRREVSEHTAQIVDQEVKRMLDEAHERARRVLEGERDLLEAIAQALLERETLGNHDVGLLAEGKTLPPLDLLRPDSSGEGGQKPAALAPRELPNKTIEGELPEEVGEREEGKEAEVPTPVARLGTEAPGPDASRG
ncbi:MAG: ATP-dependent metallopeptidase FtsH/Yme1/Tma family protein [Gemmatimonadetes bacterium]|nr:ATP-dependent metallopeptidase FtsH/Yme1/Tma family protein [Gemmatimonadota bacterium]